MQSPWTTEVDEVIVGEVEIVDAPPPPLGDAGELIELLVARFEEVLVRKEHELIALRRSLEEAEREAAAERYELQAAYDALQAEVVAGERVCRILERENERLAAEVEALRRQLAPPPSNDALLEQLLAREVGA